MRQEIVFTSDDSIAIIAPHPDDECLGAAAALLMAPDRTDVYVLTDGSHGSPDRSITIARGMKEIIRLMAEDRTFARG